MLNFVDLIAQEVQASTKEKRPRGF